MTRPAAVADRLARARITYNYCGVCGHQPKNDWDEPNYTPLRWWDPDDGWKIGSLCSVCAAEYLEAQPKPGDYAFQAHQHDACSTSPETDEDPLEAL